MDDVVIDKIVLRIRMCIYVGLKVEGQEKETEKKQKDIIIITAKQKKERNNHLKLQKKEK